MEMETKDDFLNEFREEPRAEFATSLYARLRRLDDEESDRAPIRARWRPLLIGATAVASLALLFSFPGMRATAQDFLDMFRVKRFVAVPVDPERVAQLREGKIGIANLLGNGIEELSRPSAPMVVRSVAEASAAAAMPVMVPTYVFNTDDAPAITVEPEHTGRIVADAQRLRNVLDTFGIDDVEVPPGLDGATITVHVPTAVSMRYTRGQSWVATFTQARSPQVDLPAGLSLADLGQIGLRLSGMSASEARDFARKIDWHSTLLVPVPANAGSFQEIEIRGTTGLLVALERSTGSGSASGDSPRSLLLWSEGGMIYALASTLHPVDAVEMANSLRNG